MDELKQATPVVEAGYDGPVELEALIQAGSLIPIRGMLEAASVYIIGAKKYGEESWRHCGYKWSVALSKIIRHLGAWLSGEERCPKDKQHHLASVVFWCYALMEWEKTHPELDDIRSTKGK